MNQISWPSLDYVSMGGRIFYGMAVDNPVYYIYNICMEISWHRRDA